MPVVTVIVALVLVAPAAPAQSRSLAIPKVDFVNFSYPWIELHGVPDQMRWLNPRERNKVTLVRGRQRRENDALITLDSVKYGDLARKGGLDAAVVLTYHSGGTANRQYVYI